MLLWYTLLLVASILLFYFDRQWMKLCDKLLNLFDK